MGFSLVGNSGDTKNTTNLTTNNYSADSNPQFDLTGAGPGATAVNISPITEGGNAGEIDATVDSYYAPVNISTLGAGQDDSAVQAYTQMVANLANASQPAALGASADNTTPVTASSTDTLSTLLSGNAVYWILGAIVVFFLAHHQK